VPPDTDGCGRWMNGFWGGRSRVGDAATARQGVEDLGNCAIMAGAMKADGGVDISGVRHFFERVPSLCTLVLKSESYDPEDCAW